MTINDFIIELEKLGIKINEEKLNKLERYYELLVEWNEKMNLTGITKKEDVYLKHFYDSLTLIKIVDLNSIQTLCDIGTGAGFPGLVIKIVFPSIKITLVDSLNKRITFLNEVIKELKLEKIDTIHARIEEYGVKNRELYDLVVARAVASLPMLLEYAIPLVKVNGYFVAMKGNNDEFNSINNCLKKLNIRIDNNISFQLPYENSNRLLILFKKESVTNKKYPRKFVEIKNKPL
ncbi:MAG: 16S rRNA (guanine(527)-N(7))-methyltransferase RsmG [Bacilli bacterium]|nr:16S rRNA (guanine(527)-N(7))-methyltransferase RsmG [Bacilli bacterium]